MSLKMSVAEREAFLADLHVGVLSLNDPGRGPLTAPVWYSYEPGGDIVVVTGESSRKGKLLSLGRRVSLCSQQEELPYKYVSVEGPVTSVEPTDVDATTRPMAQRYLGVEQGNAYVEGDTGEGSITVRIRPERWLTVDYAKSNG
ncbi:MAG: pyridoxamine 5'-phosphate oxidase family protein [Acidobacteriota bacterium]